MSRLLLASLLAVTLAACASSQQVGVQPRDGRAGLQVTGTMAGRQVAVSDGAPRLLAGDCSLFTPLPVELCAVSRDIDGGAVVLGIGNAAAVAASGTLEVGEPGCTSQATCREVTDHAVVLLQVADTVHPARSGSLTISEIEAGTRYVGQFSLTTADGRVTGSFDLVPRSDD